MWVAAGGRIPDPLRAVAGEPAAADATARALQRTLFPLERDGGEVYIDLRRLRDDILPLVREAEAREFAEGRKLDRKLRTAGFDAEAVAAYNESADKRFRLYRKRIAKYLER